MRQLSCMPACKQKRTQIGKRQNEPSYIIAGQKLSLHPIKSIQATRCSDNTQQRLWRLEPLRKQKFDCHKSPKQPTTATLMRIARDMLPFYCKIATNRRYAVCWSRAVTTADLDQLRALLCLASPAAARQGLGTNGIGYFVDFSLRCDVYTNGTSLIPGTARFTFNPTIHQLIARAVIPFYARLATHPFYAATVAAAIRKRNLRLVRLLVRSAIPTRNLRSIRIEERGLVLSFRFSCSRYTYRNLLFQDLVR